MIVDTNILLLSAVAAALLAATFVFGGSFYPLRPLMRDRRSMISFGAGMSSAYVFVHVLPELSEARRTLAESIALRYEGMAVYVLALVGFLCFYGLDHLRTRMRDANGESQEKRGYRTHLAGFAAYAALVAYLLVRHLEQTALALAAYVLAMMFHFLAVDHSLHEEHGAAFDRAGRFVLAGMCVIGWGAGVAIAVPPFVSSLLLAFISGAVIMNSAIMELPSDKDGRFWPFVSGGLSYALLLIPLA
jgi:hypothetical protein